jgi:hypothetical protein
MPDIEQGESFVLKIDYEKDSPRPSRDGGEIVTYYQVLKVIGVKRASGGTQLELPPSD